MIPLIFYSFTITTSIFVAWGRVWVNSAESSDLTDTFSTQTQPAQTPACPCVCITGSHCGLLFFAECHVDRQVDQSPGRTACYPVQGRAGFAGERRSARVCKYVGLVPLWWIGKINSLLLLLPLQTLIGFGCSVTMLYRQATLNTAFFFFMGRVLVSLLRT